MIDLQTVVETEMREALRSRDEVRLRTLRMLSSALHNRRIEKRSRGVDELTGEDSAAVLHSEVRKRREAIREFIAGNRKDLADREAEELAVLQAYLPAEISDQELERIVRETVSESGAVSSKDFGRMMGLVMKRIGQSASGDRAADTLRRILGDF